MIVFPALRSRFVTLISPLAGLLCLVVGALVLFGWAIDSRTLNSLVPGFLLMKPNTAVAFIFMGIALVGLSLQTSVPSIRWVAYGSAGAVTVMGTVTSIEYVLNWSPGFDEWLFRESLAVSDLRFPGRMGLNTALCTTLFGGALLLHGRTERSPIALHEGLTLGGLFIAFMAVLGYLYDDRSLYVIGQYTPMAIHTALTLLVVGLGVLGLHPDRGMVAVVTSEEVGGYMMRRLLPGALLGLPAIGWLRLYGERQGLYGTSAGLALFAASATVALFALLWWTARSLNEVDRRRRQTVAALSQSEQRQRLAWFAVDHAGDAVLWADMEQRLIYANETARRALGYDAGEISRLTIADIVPQHDPERYRHRLSLLKQGQSAQYESRHRRKDGTSFPVEVTLNYVEHDGRGYTCALVRDISERKQVEEALRSSEAKLRAVVETAGVAIVGLSPDHRIQTWNRAAEQLYGWPRADVLGQDYLELFIPESLRPLVVADIQSVLAGQSTRGFENPIRTREGLARILLWNVDRLLDANGQAVGIVAIGQDITERKRAEELSVVQLRVLEMISLARPLADTMDFLVRSIESLSDGGICSVLFLDPESGTLSRGAVSTLPESYNRAVDGFPIGSSHGSCGTAAYRKTEVIVADLATDPLWDSCPQARELALRHGLHACASMPVMNSGGDVLATYAMYFRSARRPTSFELDLLRVSSHLLCIAIERATADEALRASEERFAKVFQSSPSAVVISELESGRCLDINEACLTLLGYKWDDVMGRTADEIGHWQNPEERQRFVRVLQQAGSVRNREVLFRNKAGQLRHCLISAELIELHGKRCIITVGHDITERKQAEAALRKSEEQFRQVTEHIQEVFWLSDIEKNEVLYISPGYAAIWGRSCESLRAAPRSWLEAIHPDDRERILHAAVTKQVAGTYDEEYRILRPDGLIRWIRDRAFPIRDEQGQVVRIAGVADDVTVRKQAESALQESEERFRRLFEDAGIGMSLTDLHGCFLKVNRSYCDLLGYREDELLGKTFMDITHPDDLVPNVAIRDQVVNDPSRVYHFEKRYWHKAGYAVWAAMTVSVLIDDAGRPQYLVGQAQDITARKRAEADLLQAHEELERRVIERTAALAESQRQLELILEATAVATWDWDVTTGAVQYNEQWAANRGLSLKEVKPHVSLWSDEVHPEDRAHVMRTLKDCLDGHVAFYEAEMRIRTAAGEWIWIMDRGRVVERDAQGKALRMAGIEIDITARRRAEQALRESEERYSSLVSQATDVIYTAGPDGRFSFVNAAACRIMGYSESELLGMHYLELIRPDYRDAAQRLYRQQVQGRTPSTYLEFPAVTKDGREIWFGQRVQVRIAEGQLLGVEAIARDISDRKKAQHLVEERAKCNAFAADVSLMLNLEESLDRQLQYCADAAVKHLGSAFARIWLRGAGDLCSECHKASWCRDRTECLHLRASAGLSANLNGEYRRIPMGALKIGRIAQGKGPLHSNDVVHDDLLPNKSWMQENGLQSFAGFPLAVEGQAFGVFALFGREAMSASMRQTIETVSNGLAAALARKRAETALRESEDQFAKTFQSSPHAIIVTEMATGRLLDANRACTEIFGYERDEIIGRTVFELGLWKDSEARQQFLEQIRNNGGVRNIELPLPTKFGITRLFLVSAEAIVLGGKECLVTIGNDITGRKQAEAALAEAYERLQALTRRLIEAEEGERRRIARELHDEFGQVLTCLKFDMAWLTKRLPSEAKSSEAAALKAKASAMMASVDGLIQSVRVTAAALRPSVLDDLGLVAAIEWLVTSFRERTGLPCELTIDPEIREVVMGPEVTTTVFRGMQELLTNVMRHAQASSVSVEFTAERGRLVLKVTDNGRGIQGREWERTRSLGLRGVQERVRLLGGTADIIGAPGVGTTVTLCIPLPVGVAQTVEKPL